MISISLKAAVAAATISLGTFAMVPAASAASATQAEQRSAAIVYSDLDLSTEEGIAELDRRIDRAAREVCSMHGQQTGTRIASREARTCVLEAKRELNRHLAQSGRITRMGG